MKKIFFILATTIILTSCNTTLQKSKYDKYLDEHVVNKSEKALYIFIPIDICQTCLNNVIQHLNIIEKNNIYPIFIAKSKREILPFRRKLSKHYKIKYETKNKDILNTYQIKIVMYNNKKGYSDFNFEEDNDYNIIRLIDKF